MPVLVELLPTLTDPTLVSAVAAHLRRPWARPTAFGPLVGAFRLWAPLSADAGWQLADALATAARPDDLPVLLDLVSDTRYCIARQMIVDSHGDSGSRRWSNPPLCRSSPTKLWRCTPCRHCAGRSARRRPCPTSGKSALPYLRQVAADQPGDRLGKTAAS